MLTYADVLCESSRHADMFVSVLYTSASVPYVRECFGTFERERGCGRGTQTQAHTDCNKLAYVSIRQHPSAYVSIRQHTSAYVSEAHRLKPTQTAIW
jgi:hypothetical protein